MKVSETLSQWRQARLWGRETDSPTERSDCITASDATNLVADVCVNFARMLSWKSAAWLEDHVQKFVLTENAGVEQEESRIEIVVAPEGQLRIKGIFYDAYHHPLVVSDQYVPLSWVDRRRLGELLTDILVRLKRQKGAYSGSDSSLGWL